MKAIHIDTAAEVEALVKNFDDEMKQVHDALNLIAADPRYTDEGKKQFSAALKDQAHTCCTNSTALVKKIVSEYLNEMEVRMPDTAAPDPAAIANILKVIDMMGYNLTSDVLRTVLEPVRDSYKTLKMIADLIWSKNENSVTGGYRPEIHNLLSEYLYMFNDIQDYLDTFENIKDTLNSPAMFTYSIGSCSNSTAVSLDGNASYSVLALPSWIRNLGEKYSHLESKYPMIFTKHIPTNEEIMLEKLNDPEQVKETVPQAERINVNNQ